MQAMHALKIKGIYIFHVQVIFSEPQMVFQLIDYMVCDQSHFMVLGW